MSESRSWKRIIGVRVVVFLVAVVAAVTIAEVALRLLALPGIDFNNTRYDDTVGTTRYPGTILTYRNDRGACVRRRINSWGYAEAEHPREKADGAFRIGFFGDSYTESIQVDLEETYFRIVQARLGDRGIECLAFGHSGFGTLHACLEGRRWAPACDLDLVVYVFCENDLADNIFDISRNGYYPSAVLTEDGFRVDNSFRERYGYKRSPFFRAYDYLTAHSLFAATVSSRIRLLFRYGIKPTVTEADRLMATASGRADDPGSPPAATDLPSVWPTRWREYATELGRAIITEWRREVEGQGRSFAILYIPRPGEMEKEAAEQDAWKSWLESLCADEGIPFIDPSPDLIASRAAGKEVFYDHFTRDGHEAVAHSIIRWLEGTPWLARGGERAGPRGIEAR